MSETIGSLCDKLTIVKLKQYHNRDKIKKDSLISQEKQLIEEINDYLKDCFSGKIPLDRINFASNKVYKPDSVLLRSFDGNFGEIFSALSSINCELWHEQEKVYEFKSIPLEQKDKVIEKLASLNLERNRCIDNLNSLLFNTLKSMKDEGVIY